MLLANPVALKSDHFGIEIGIEEGVAGFEVGLKSDHFGIEMNVYMKWKND